MKTDCTLANQSYQLFRYPKLQHDKSLQAWDSADELAVNTLVEQWQDTPKTLTILNDSFGALTIGLHKFKPNVITDSKVAQLATVQNCQHNDIEAPAFLTSLQPLPETECYLIKLTKNLDYLRYQCHELSKLEHNFEIVLSGKVTQVTSPVLKIVEQYFDNVHTSLAKKKSRLIFATKASINPQQEYINSCINWDEKQITLKSFANVFCKDQLDIGGRFLAEQLPKLEENNKVIDLGCGNGLLGLAVLQQAKSQNKKIGVTFVDESYMAVASAKQNVQDNFPQQFEQCGFVVNNCLENFEHQADVILCNPPFHQQNAITEHIAKQMFNDGYRCLSQGGKLFVVANRHLAYQQELKKVFGGFKVHQQNKKFIIYLCYK